MHRDMGTSTFGVVTYLNINVSISFRCFLQSCSRTLAWKELAIVAILLVTLKRIVPHGYIRRTHEQERIRLRFSRCQPYLLCNSALDYSAWRLIQLCRMNVLGVPFYKMRHCLGCVFLSWTFVIICHTVVHLGGFSFDNDKNLYTE